MWQRFTEKARKTVFYAQEEAQHFGEGYVSTEHMLLGLLREEDHTGAKVLEASGINIVELRDTVVKQLPRSEARPNQDMTLTPRAKRVIDLSYEEARNLHNDYIGTEHLLLGLLREGDGLAGRILFQAGASLEAFREQIRAIQTEQGTVGQGEGSEFRQHKAVDYKSWEHRDLLRKVKEWAEWGNQFVNDDLTHDAELKALKAKLDTVVTELQQSFLVALCLEVSDGGSVAESKIWKELQLTKEQAEAMVEIGAEVKKLLADPS